MKKLWISVAVLGVLGFVGYKYISNYSIADKLDFKVRGHYLKFSSLSSASVELYLDVTSKLPVNVTIKGYDLDLIVNGSKLVNIKSSSEQQLIKDQTNIITIASEFNPTTLLGSLFSFAFFKQIVKNKLNSTIELKGTMNASLMGVELSKIPVDINSTLADFVVTTPVGNA